MFYKVKDVIPLENYILQISFENGEVKQYDIKKVFHKWQAFKSLTQIHGLYKQVKVDVGGYAVFWNDDLDLACNELYNPSYK